MSQYRNLGNFAVSNHHSIGLTCDHCMVSWNGCAAESCCPECSAPKGYHEDDYDECYCHVCKPEQIKSSQGFRTFIPGPDGGKTMIQPKDCPPYKRKSNATVS